MSPRLGRVWERTVGGSRLLQSVWLPARLIPPVHVLASLRVVETALPARPQATARNQGRARGETLRGSAAPPVTRRHVGGREAPLSPSLGDVAVDSHHDRGGGGGQRGLDGRPRRLQLRAGHVQVRVVPGESARLEPIETSIRQQLVEPARLDLAVNALLVEAADI